MTHRQQKEFMRQWRTLRHNLDCQLISTAEQLVSTVPYQQVQNPDDLAHASFVHVLRQFADELEETLPGWQDCPPAPADPRR